MKNLATHFSRRPAFAAATLLVLAAAQAATLCRCATSVAAESPDANLIQEESRIAERFSRLEILAGRLAELSRSTQPRRARLLRDLVAKSREEDVAGYFEAIVQALEEDRLGTAAAQQTILQKQLVKLLELLLQEDREREIESQRNRIAKYLAQLNKLIRQQRGIKARTDGGDQAEKLAQDQQRVAQQTQQLRKQINQTEGPSAAPPEETGEAADSEQDGKPGKPADKSPPSDPPQPGQDKGNQGKPGEEDSSGSPSPGQPQPAPESDSQTPAEKAAQRLQQARQRMEQAQQRLEKANRENAVQEQQQALRELEQAKAELERILRQLREEELERMLVLLEARFRKMLDAQIEVFEETQRMDASAAQAPVHELEIACGRLSRKESQIVREADRALILLREDGTSVAFPEALQQARDDMVTIADRLVNVQLGQITQGLEEDVIATLEEILASLRQAIKELRKQQARQQQGGGQPGEQALVDQLAELRMIRALQARVNRRTARYGKLIEGEQALEADLLEALDQLAIRQERIFEATRDLDTGRNQ